MEKGVRFSTLEIVIRVQGIILTVEIKTERVYLTARRITSLFRVAKTDKNNV